MSLWFDYCIVESRILWELVTFSQPTLEEIVGPKVTRNGNLSET